MKLSSISTRRRAIALAIISMLVGLWVWSEVAPMVWARDRGDAYALLLARGSVSTMVTVPGYFDGLHARMTEGWNSAESFLPSSRRYWWPRIKLAEFLSDIRMPFWTLIAGTFLWLAWPVVRARALVGGRCASCGYSLAGLRSPRCPECGSEIASDQSRSRTSWARAARAVRTRLGVLALSIAGLALASELWPFGVYYSSGPSPQFHLDIAHGTVYASYLLNDGTNGLTLSRGFHWRTGTNWFRELLPFYDQRLTMGTSGNYTLRRLAFPLWLLAALVFGWAMFRAYRTRAVR